MNKLNSNSGVLIGSRIFTLDDQIQFSKFSGDLNPIHIDPILARRTIAGKCIVYGVSAFMYAIDFLANYKGITIDHFDVKFLKFIPLGIEIRFFWNEDKHELSITSGNTIHTSAFITFSYIPKDGDISTIKSNKPLISPRNMTLQECSEITEEDLIFRGDIEVGKLLFPSLFENYSEAFIAELVSTSEIVGMEIPGLNSLFLSIKGYLLKTDSNSCYQVESCDLGSGILRLLLKGAYLKAQIETIYRPFSKDSPSIHQIHKIVRLNEFKNVNALIIGGSRGIGEITSKIIAAGGGEVTLSYNLGKQDAEKLQKEISHFGGECSIFQLDIEDGINIPHSDFNQIYYFATPKITPEDSGISDANLKNVYQFYYVSAFHNLLTQVLENNMPVSIFYPSSTFINNPSKMFAQYIDAKLAGELLCQEFINTKEMTIIFPRLPRLATDQTLGLIPERLEDSIDVMYPYIQSMV